MLLAFKFLTHFKTKNNNDLMINHQNPNLNIGYFHYCVQTVAVEPVEPPNTKWQFQSTVGLFVQSSADRCLTY